MKRELFNDLIKLGLAAGVLAIGMPDLAAAAGTLADTVQQTETNMNSMPTVLSGLAYLGGGATMLHGAGLLKKHADQPTGTPLAQGLTRLGIGAFVASLPVAIGYLQSSLSQGSQNTGFHAMDKITG